MTTSAPFFPTLEEFETITDVLARPNVIRDAVTQAGAVLVRGLTLSQDDLGRAAGIFGTVEPIDDIAEGGAMLVLDARADGDAIIKGCGALPLHTDGILRDKRVDFIVLYCPLDPAPESGGETVVCQQVVALARLPRHLRDVLGARGLEYRVREAGYFRAAHGPTWIEVPAIVHEHDEAQLRVALAFAPDAAASWDVRVPGIPDDESRRIMAELETHLSAPPFLYAHPWAAGDLLVVDNRRSLHGRRPILKAGARTLWRLQVNE